jgi:UDP-glucose 4-epimerase
LSENGIAEVKKIIYASSGSVYGIKKEKKVMEELDLNPISTYNKVKMVTERVLISYKDFVNEQFIIDLFSSCNFSLS